MMRVWILAAALAATPGYAFDGCPEGAERVQTSWTDRPWVCAWTEGPGEAGCPNGSREVGVPNATRPSRCAIEGGDPEPPKGGCPKGQRSQFVDGKLRCVKGQAAAPVVESARCPKGHQAEYGRHLKKGFRCVPLRKEAKRLEEAAPPPRAAGCPAGTRRVRTEDPFEPVKCVPDASAPGPAVLGPWARYEIPGQLVFEYPEGWNVTDAWKDEVPTLFVRPDLDRDGKPVTLTVSRYRARGSARAEMDAAIRQEVEWHGAKDGGKGSVAGLPARFLEVPKETKLAYLLGAEGYLVLAYTAPEDLYRAYAPAYARLLKSLRVVHGDTDPVPEDEGE
ncbi:MAG: hypothetical protein HY553_22815 [Elusimicrobia bacterium]|nr:hypothetical protein [Elusimicrobiota bacterium]